MGEQAKGIYRVQYKLRSTDSICGIMLITKMNFDLTLSFLLDTFLSILGIFLFVKYFYDK